MHILKLYYGYYFMPKHIIITINEYDFVSSFPTFYFGPITIYGTLKYSVIF